METFDLFIWFFLLATPIYGYFTHAREIAAIETGRKPLITCYWQTICFLWPAAILVLLNQRSGIAILPEYQAEQWWGLLLIILLSSVFSYGIYQVIHSEEARQETKKAMSSVAWLMPKTKPQLVIFILGVCVSAGIAEEIVYRGYLLPMLMQHMNTYLAVLISSLIFGLPHIYQGISGVLKTALLGGVFCIIVLLFDSLLLAMVCHFLIDAYSGYLYYVAYTKKPA